METQTETTIFEKDYKKGLKAVSSFTFDKSNTPLIQLV